MGKINNLLSSDLAMIEQRLFTLLLSTAFPLMVVGVTIILIVRIGWVGIIGVILMMLMIPICKNISEKNGLILKEVNKFKDKRVHTTTEVIEGIKYIKLYGW